MIDIYVLDADLNPIGIIDSYKSLIWAKRYYEIGDCELYLTANETNLSLLVKGNYLARNDDDMLCQIRKIEIDTDAEEGNYLIVTAYDAKKIIDQRIFWTTYLCNQRVEQFYINAVYNAFIQSSHTQRIMYKSDGTTKLLKLGADAGLQEVKTEQITYKNIGEKIRDICKEYGWGYRLVLDNGQLAFEFYKGVDRNNEVVFSDYYENLASTKYVQDASDLGNCALIGGTGEGSLRTKQTYGNEKSGVNRYEKFIDAKDLSREITYGELTDAYPTGTVQTASPHYYYVTEINIPIISAEQLAWLQSKYTSPHYTTSIVTIYGIDYFRIQGGGAYVIYLATVNTDDVSTITDSTKVTLEDVLYYPELINRGIERLRDFGEKTTFEGSVFPDITFVYKEDYNIGDIVKVENQYGKTATARIVEVVEVVDDNGHSIEPKFEKWEVS